MRNFLLKPTDTLRAALQRVSANGEGFAAVADDDRQLLGTFCDADGRHALLQGVSLDEPVESVMVAGNKRLNRLPGRIVVKDGVITEVLTRAKSEVDAVVMAGGKGTRLRSLTGGVPKPLLTLGGSTILDRILGNLAKAGAHDTWLSVGYKANMFKKHVGDGSQHGLDVHYLSEETPLGNAGALALLPKDGADEIFVTNADLITDVDYARMFDYHRAHGAAITMAAASFTTQLKYGVVRHKRGVLTAMEEKPAFEFLCNAGMYVLDRWVLDLVPPDTFFQMPDLMDAVRELGRDVQVFPLYERWVDAGSPEEFQQVMVEFATGKVK